MLISMITDTIIQVVLFALIPFFWWFFTARKKQDFFSWIGLYKPQIADKGKFLMLSVVTLCLLLLPGMALLFSFEDKSILAGAKFAGTGFEGLVSIFIFSFIQTGLAEEIMFRGFAVKRMANKIGFVKSNVIQALIFGLVHGALLFAVLPPLTVILVILFTFAAGYLMAYINEKYANGSIIPSWIMHGLMNLISSVVFWMGIIQV